jgi:hypothetical protein
LRNTGNVRYTDIVVQGSNAGLPNFVAGPSNCTIAELAPGDQTAACNATMFLTLSDFDMGVGNLQVDVSAATVWPAIRAANSTLLTTDLTYARQLCTTLVSSVEGGSH